MHKSTLRMFCPPELLYDWHIYRVQSLRAAWKALFLLHGILLLLPVI
jgi:hypothetical protein